MKRASVVETVPCETVFYCRDMIDVLKAENADLVKNLHLAGSKQNEIKDRRITSKLEELLLKQGTPNLN